ncbi:FAD-dependent pyridine nucleotide-disulfide oxidoreductase [Sulfobacillus acidophilus TPY]|uniref:FAD-dependent pyridine nucleotide-disulfide oxidoreductase n=1 Tax=Sulfobacillus acidophilus (strain ATCC 700253 / DSM 10332 / NAL) TaxID=679936 RepID=G8TVA8_SULAD|nr:FAD-dependent pyridine nucleotide-disulfide oxidoreductase [Sulfobacillus acidophilus TPY]AEW04748.1 FAD-dependent pyridine nucleotide-disulfide oxidoreductase [Sulfobacillus acidophilus DSM 10332]
MYDVAVIGAGPAGASAAMFLAKAGLKTLMLDNGLSVTRRALIKNHYGAPEITGPDLVDTGKNQAAQLGAEIMTADVTNLTHQDDHLVIETDHGTYEARQVILATGLYTDLAERIGVKTKPGTEPRIKTIIDVTPEGKTSMEGVWAAGTVAGVSMHTIITAGDGAKVAINLLSELKGARYVDHDVYKPAE